MFGIDVRGIMHKVTCQRFTQRILPTKDPFRKVFRQDNFVWANKRCFRVATQ